MNNFRILFSFAFSLLLLSACDQEGLQTPEPHSTDLIADFLALPQIDAAQSAEAGWYNQLLTGRLSGGRDVTAEEVQAAYRSGGSVYLILRKRSYPNATELAEAYEQHVLTKEQAATVRAEWLNRTNTVSERELRGALLSNLSRRLLSAGEARRIIVQLNPQANETKHLTCVEEFNGNWNDCTDAYMDENSHTWGDAQTLYRCRDLAVTNYEICSGLYSPVGPSFGD